MNRLARRLTQLSSITAAGFWYRGVEFFAAHGIDRMARVLNASYHRNKAFSDALGGTVKKCSRPVPTAIERE